MRPTLFLLVLILSVAGCGYKGPLYLPDQKPGAKKPVPKPVTPATPAAPAALPQSP